MSGNEFGIHVTQYCLLLAACCLLLAVCCLLLAACCLLLAVCCLLSAVCCLLLPSFVHLNIFMSVLKCYVR